MASAADNSNAPATDTVSNAFTTAAAVKVLRRILEEGRQICNICHKLDATEKVVVMQCGDVICVDCANELIYLPQLQLQGSENRIVECPICEEFVDFYNGVIEMDPAAAFGNLADDPSDAVLVEHEDSLATQAVQSSKILKLIEILTTDESEHEEAEPRPIKTAIFSQWTAMLDLIEPALHKANIKFVRLDGKMTRVKRAEALRALAEDNSVSVILVSLKAGGTGLNLVAASRVIMTDVWWNPSTEMQAVDRIYRLGQTRPVTTYRLVVKDSIEEGIIRMQARKRALAEITLDQSAAGEVKLKNSKKSRRGGNAAERREELQRKRLEELRDLF